MIKIRMANRDEFLVDDIREDFIEDELHYAVGNTSIQYRGLRTINTVEGELTINADQISSIEDIK
ncbi:hypothetical protein [Clostridium baratii]|uniref:hypothetical protein n=1 Tax=Clostridium baratii TaxID=1561 RepID=UPI0022E7B134|nr:hypothetical protein [Clostridium baratii]